MWPIRRKTIKKRLRAKLKAIKVELRKCMHDPIAKIGSWVKQMPQGHLNYYAVSGNHPSMRFVRIVERFFPPIKVLHPLPLHRFDVGPVIFRHDCNSKSMALMPRARLSSPASSDASKC